MLPAHYKLLQCTFRFVIRRNVLYKDSGSKTDNIWSSSVDCLQHVTHGCEKVILVILQRQKRFQKKKLLIQINTNIKQILTNERGKFTS